MRPRNRRERVIETLRAALNVVATAVPAWLQAAVPASWLDRYGLRAEDARLPHPEAERTAYAESVGGDGSHVLQALYAETAPPWLRALPAVDILRHVWVQHFLPVYEGGARWRAKEERPPAAQSIHAPSDPEAHDAKKRDHAWLGDNVHRTEACAEDLPPRITTVHTTAAPTGDHDALPAMHTALAHAARLPRTPMVDAGDVEAKRLFESREPSGIDVVGPTPGNHRWQSPQGLGCDVARFPIDWDAKQARCPAGKLSSSGRPGIDHRGNEVVNIVCAKSDCRACPHLPHWTTATSKRRSINVRAQAFHEA